uniref:Uncharacterized protein n=1 Tax=Aureoumbra lagunensis TaxID=44058 RepID=A0A7S3JVT1_9STRA|mmetsp:Transcript_19603/g.25374  ORF Transcript_19603/g.25374 Transcript_19603/m.25374 type:complete len:131 (-) Transcript_19603:76-468(-)
MGASGSKTISTTTTSHGSRQAQSIVQRSAELDTTVAIDTRKRKTAHSTEDEMNEIKEEVAIDTKKRKTIQDTEDKVNESRVDLHILLEALRPAVADARIKLAVDRLSQGLTNEAGHILDETDTSRCVRIH